MKFLNYEEVKAKQPMPVPPSPPHNLSLPPLQPRKLKYRDLSFPMQRFVDFSIIELLLIIGLYAILLRYLVFPL